MPKAKPIKPKELSVTGFEWKGSHEHLVTFSDGSQTTVTRREAINGNLLINDKQYPSSLTKQQTDEWNKKHWNYLRGLAEANAEKSKQAKEKLTTTQVPPAPPTTVKVAVPKQIDQKPPVIKKQPVKKQPLPVKKAAIKKAVPKKVPVKKVPVKKPVKFKFLG